MYIFLSHSSTNYKVAQKVCNLIEECGWKCFLAPRDIRTGHEYAEQILEGIERSDVLLLILSKEANTSPHVLREVERAVSKKIPIIVYKLEEVELSKSMEYFLMSHQWVSSQPGVNYAEIINCLAEFDNTEEPKEVKDLVNYIQRETNERNLTYVFLWVLLLMAIMGVGMFIWSRMTDDKGGQGQFPVSQESVSVTEEPEETDIPAEFAEVEPGDTIIFGSYNGEPIEWRVLKLAEDGSSATVVSKDILTMKAFDAAESGSYNYYNGKDYWGEDISKEEETVLHQIRGNNLWALSNIRTWLNSTAENVTYEDQKPIQISMSEYKNGYDTEPGFLSNFSEEEREVIIETEVETNGEVTRDKVFLLSTQELAWFEEADVSLVVKPTEAAREQDTSDWYEVNVSSYGVDDYCWWLRDCDLEGLASEAYLVGSSYSGCKIYTETVGLEGYGIRPALTIDLSADCITVK